MWTRERDHPARGAPLGPPHAEIQVRLFPTSRSRGVEEEERTREKRQKKEIGQQLPQSEKKEKEKEKEAEKRGEGGAGGSREDQAGGKDSCQEVLGGSVPRNWPRPELEAQEEDPQEGEASLEEESRHFIVDHKLRIINVERDGWRRPVAGQVENTPGGGVGPGGLGGPGLGQYEGTFVPAEWNRLGRREPPTSSHSVLVSPHLSAEQAQWRHQPGICDFELAGGFDVARTHCGGSRCDRPAFEITGTDSSRFQLGHIAEAGASPPAYGDYKHPSGASAGASGSQTRPAESPAWPRRGEGQREVQRERTREGAERQGERKGQGGRSEEVKRDGPQGLEAYKTPWG